MTSLKKCAFFSYVTALTFTTQALYAQETDINRVEFEALIKRVNALEVENAKLKTANAKDSAQESGLGTETYSENLVGRNSEYSFNMLDHAVRTNTKQKYQLNALRDGMLDSKLTLGGQITAIGNYQNANENSKFGWLMRHPTSSNQIGENSSEAVIHAVNINMTARLTNDLTGYVELLYNPEQNFASGSTITGLPRNNVNLSRAYILWGNLNKSPVYASLGKMDIPFGWNDTVSPFTNSTNWHSFAGLAYGGLVGYAADNIHLRAMAVQGGAQFRNANTPVSGTNVPSKLNNFALDANYTTVLNHDVTLNIGASYQYGSSYCQEYVNTPETAHTTPKLIQGVTRNQSPQGVQHFNPCKENNDAAAVYVVYKDAKKMLVAEFAETLNVWPGTHNPYIPQFEAVKNKTFTLGGRYSADVGLSKPVDFSTEFSRYRAGASSSPWEKQDQLVFGTSYFLTPSVDIFAETIFVKGWVPLNFLSGGNPGSLVGSSWSSQSSKNQILVIGIQAGI